MLKDRKRAAKGKQLASASSVSQTSFSTEPAGGSNLMEADDDMAQYDQNIAEMEDQLMDPGEEAVENGRGRGEEVEEETIFGCLGPPTPNADQPDAPMNVRALASAVANHALFERLILCTIIASAGCFLSRSRKLVTSSRSALTFCPLTSCLLTSSSLTPSVSRLLISLSDPPLTSPDRTHRSRPAMPSNLLPYTCWQRSLFHGFPPQNPEPHH